MDGADPNEGENTQHGHMTGNMCISAPLPSPRSSACLSKTMKESIPIAPATTRGLAPSDSG
jgi:hypothetical protein